MSSGQGWTLRGFEGSLTFELGCEAYTQERDREKHAHAAGGGEADWQTQPRVKVRNMNINEDEEGELGDSCCFGTRTVEVGLDCVWKLHGGL